MALEGGGGKSWIAARVKLDFHSSEAKGKWEDEGESGMRITY